MKKVLSFFIVSVLFLFSFSLSSSAVMDREYIQSGSFYYYKLSYDDGNVFLGDFIDYLKGQIPTWHLQNYFIAYQCYSFGSQDIYVYYYYAFDKSVTSIDLSYNSAILLDKVIAVGSSQLYISDNTVTGYYGNFYGTYGIDNPGKYYSSYRSSVYKDGFADNGQTYILRSSNLQIYVDDTLLDIGSFKSPVTVDIDFNKTLDFTYYLNANAVLPAKHMIYFSIYDMLPAIPKFVYTPYKYVNIVNGVTTVDAVINCVNTSPQTYYITPETLRKYCEPNRPYEARAYIHTAHGIEEIACFEFRINEDGFYQIVDNIKDHGPVQVTKDDNGNDVYTDLNTGEVIDPDSIVYTFNSDVNINVDTGVEVPDFDFNINFDTDLTQGAGLVRTLFDKMISTAGIGGYVTVILVVCVVGWFVFGSRR